MSCAPLSMIDLDAVLALDAHMAHRALVSAMLEPEAFAHLSDLELARRYECGPADQHDAMYCQLHLRGLTPWKLVSAPALEIV